jgi:hypothetical protein
MSSFRPLLAILWVLLAGVEAQYGAMETAEGLSPRFYLGNSPLPQLDRRQSGLCASDLHSCTLVSSPPFP